MPDSPRSPNSPAVRVVSALSAVALAAAGTLLLSMAVMHENKWQRPELLAGVALCAGLGALAALTAAFPFWWRGRQ